jgi:hypothetical protein
MATNAPDQVRISRVWSNEQAPTFTYRHPGNLDRLNAFLREGQHAGPYHSIRTVPRDVCEHTPSAAQIATPSTTKGVDGSHS